MSKNTIVDSPEVIAAFNDLNDALNEVVTILPSTAIPGFATVNIKREIHDNSGKAIPAQIHFMDQYNNIYCAVIEEQTDTGFVFHLGDYTTPTGEPFTMQHLYGLIFADSSLAHLIDIDKARAALKKLTVDTGGQQPPAHHEKSKRKAAEAAGALISAGERQISITAKDYQFALTQRRNDTAYIMAYNPDFMENLTFENGRLSFVKSGVESVEIMRESADGLTKVNDIDLPLLRQIFTAAYKAKVSKDSHTFTVYLPTFCKEMGIDIQSGKPSALFAKIGAFKNCMGFMGQSWWKILDVIGYDETANTIVLTAPYFMRLMDAIEDHNTKVLKSGQSYITPAYCRLFHSSVVNERNKPAIEIANRIIAGLQQRGATPQSALKQNRSKKSSRNNDIVEYSTSFRKIIDDVPLLRDRIDSSATTADKNKILKRAFTGAYKILREKTDVYAYYISLNIPEITPSMTTLGQALIITHKGINGDYVNP